MSWFSMRMQPYEANVPIDSGRLVPWIAYSPPDSVMAATPIGLFGAPPGISSGSAGLAAVLTTERAAAVRARRAVRFDMTAGPVLVTVAVRLSSPAGCASAHMAVSGLETSCSPWGKRLHYPAQLSHVWTTLPATITT